MSDKHTTKQFGLRIPPKLRQELEDYARHSEKSMTQVILDAVRFYLDNL